MSIVSYNTRVIHWYGVMYVVAFWTAWFTLPLLGKMRGVHLLPDEWTRIVAFGALGVIVGGRVGYALFYEPLYFFQHPFELFAIWNGGMSSHGGFIGAALGVWWARGVRDVLTVPVAIGLALGRVGNIINHEFGTYPYYEAAGDVIIAVVCYFMLRVSVVSSPLPFWERVRVRGVVPINFPSSALRQSSGHLLPEREKGAPNGTTFAIFLLLYSVLRFSLEYIRPQEWPFTFGLSRGQLLTIPLFIVAVILLKNAQTQRISETV